MDDVIIEFLAAGESAESTAALCGLTVSTIQEKLQDPNFLKQVQAKGKELRESRVENMYAKTEEKILRRVQKEADSEFSEVAILVRALEVVAKNRVAYRNPASHFAPGSVQLNQVTVLIPQNNAAEKVIINSKSEIISIGERNLAPMPIEGVKDVFKTLEAKQGGSNANPATEATTYQSFPIAASA